MIDKKFLETLRADYLANEKERRQIINASNNLLFEAKKIIFLLQRQDFKEAEKKFAELESLFKNLAKKFGLERLKKEGTYKAAAEEYLEAKTLFLVIKK